MRFVSKSMNYRIVLRAALPGEPLLGRPPIPGLSVKFNGGEAIVNEESVVKMLMENPAYNNDYFCADNITNDPYANMRAGVEPAHVMTEFKFGHVDSVKTSKLPTSLPPSIKKMIEEEIERGTRARLAQILQNAEAERAKKEFILGKDLDRSIPPPKTEIDVELPSEPKIIVPGGIEGSVEALVLPPRPIAPQWQPEEAEDMDGYLPPQNGPEEEAPKKKTGRPAKKQ